MGQYWKPINLDKREYVDPHRLGAGLKLWEQLAAHPGTAAALIVLCAAMPEKRGGGDFDVTENWHGAERETAMRNGQIDGCTPGPMPDDYPTIARRTIGRWAGCRIALIGDYAEDSDLPPDSSQDRVSQIYELCQPADYLEDGMIGYTDITDDVCAVIEHELNGRFSGEGWRDWQEGSN